MIKRLLGLIKGRPTFQPFLEKLNLSILHVMGIGTGGKLGTGGEIISLKYIQNKISGSKSPVFFDVGANIGDYSVILSEMFPNAQIFAFEPSSKTFEILRRKHPPSVKVLNLGLGDYTGKAALFICKNNSAIASIYKRNLSGKHTFDGTEAIEIDTIDNFSFKNGISKIDLLKLDVEGNELKCLIGAKRMLSDNNIRFIQFEFGGCNTDSRTFLKDFYDLLGGKYRLWRIMQHGLYEIKKYSETNERFITTNYLAEHL